MIKLEITQSTEPHAIGIYDYCFDQVFAGRSKKCDLIFSDQQFPPNYLTITAKDKYMTIENYPDSLPFLINGKKTNGTFKLKNNDIVIFGNHHMKILDFKKSDIQIDLASLYEKATIAPVAIKTALSFIEEKLLELEKAE
jgi:hypothetical protein